MKSCSKCPARVPKKISRGPGESKRLHQGTLEVIQGESFERADVAIIRTVNRESIRRASWGASANLTF